jgi:crossover junction endodeoxyribonuclease RusA
MKILLPFPDAKLAGHNAGHWSNKNAAVRDHRNWAYIGTLAMRGNRAVAKRLQATKDDIPLIVTFVPDNNRGDRTNYPNRMKPYYDGIAEALGVNDKRFLPQYVYEPAQKPGHVIVEIGSD